MDGRQYEPGLVPEYYGTQDDAATHLCWLRSGLAALGAAWVHERLVRIDLPQPALAKASARLNALAVQVGASRARKETA